MSLKRENLIWQPDKVLRYLFGELKQKIEVISPVYNIYLYGSRAHTAYGDWGTALDGKDWDILIVCRFPIVNTKVWTTDLGYYIDLKVTDKKGADTFFKYQKHWIEMYPENNLKNSE
ncbi:hypothetical protein E0W68_03910 [Flavobacterium salilacus subsp. salilacus]|uniref:hypothetical protein n=1 Tax=Flavobacterium TaxID=237 RepID=UPI0010754663|nr:MULTISPECIES: hypothetical protein [Flavobacterium]KAF2519501.1 hypothetical protein E0W68_03910 [Flavobacterium salilacus subsp. salilacus]MBE1614601.1 hypothetical protein [Flavobacterium sp. SaA2.13]